MPAVLLPWHRDNPIGFTKRHSHDQILGRWFPSLYCTHRKLAADITERDEKFLARWAAEHVPLEPFDTSRRFLRGTGAPGAYALFVKVLLTFTELVAALQIP